MYIRNLRIDEEVDWKGQEVHIINSVSSTFSHSISMSNDRLYISLHIYHRIQILHVPSTAREHIQHYGEVRVRLLEKKPLDYKSKMNL